MTGIDHLINAVLRALKIDPNEIVGQFRTALARVQGLGEHFDAKLTEVERRLAAVEASNQAILERMNHDGHDNADTRKLVSIAGDRD